MVRSKKDPAFAGLLLSDAILRQFCILQQTFISPLTGEAANNHHRNMQQILPFFNLTRSVGRKFAATLVSRVRLIFGVLPWFLADTTEIAS